MCAPKDKRGSLGTAVKSECLLYSERQNISCYTPHLQRSIHLVRFLGLFRLFWLTENQEASATEKNSVWYLKRTQWETGMWNWGDRAGQSTKNTELYSFWEATCTLLAPDKCGINKPRISCIMCLEMHYNLYQNTPREKTLIFRTVWYYPDSAICQPSAGIRNTRQTWPWRQRWQLPTRYLATIYLVTVINKCSIQ